MTATEITRAIHNLTGVAQTCSYVEEAVHFYGTQKTALGEDITTVLKHVLALEKCSRSNASGTARRWPSCSAPPSATTAAPSSRSISAFQVTQLVENNRRQQLLIARLEKVLLERNAEIIELRADRQKYAEEVQQLGEVLIGAGCVAPFSEIKARAVELRKARLDQPAKGYDANLAGIAANLWEKLATHEGEDADAQLIIESAIRAAIDAAKGTT